MAALCRTRLSTVPGFNVKARSLDGLVAGMQTGAWKPAWKKSVRLFERVTDGLTHASLATLLTSSGVVIAASKQTVACLAGCHVEPQPAMIVWGNTMSLLLSDRLKL